jgi:hypothetical protein
MRVAYHPAVQRDVSRIVQHYDGINNTLGDEFWEELKSFISRAAANPQRFHFERRDRRRVDLTRFPYHFHFREIAGAITRSIWTAARKAINERNAPPTLQRKEWIDEND